MPSLDVLTSPIPYRALVVDDDEHLCAMLVSILAQAGWEVVRAHSVADATRVLEDRQHPLDLAIIDIKLPDGDGMDLVTLAQARRQPPDVVIMTGFATDQAYLRAIRAGVLDFLTKPFTPSHVGEMLRNRSVRERQRLGIIVERFERVDAEIESVQRELHHIRDILLKTWEGAAQQVAQVARRGGGTS